MSSKSSRSTPGGLIGPLTTEFIPAATCIGQGIQVVRYVSNSAEGYDYYLTIGPGVSTCFPSSTFPLSGSYYSPGKCPSGYTTACMTTGGNSIGNAIEYTAKCCPMRPYPFECNTRPIGSDWGVFADCTTATSSFEVDLSVIGGEPDSKLVSSSSDAAGNPILDHAIINAYGMEVRWQQTDEALLFSTLPSPTTSPTGPGTSQSTMSTQMAGASRLNGGAIAGIVVGSVVGALILLGIVALAIRRSKKKQRLGTINNEPTGDRIVHPEAHTAPPAEPTAEPPTQDPMGVFPKYELPMPTNTGVLSKHELADGLALSDTATMTEHYSPQNHNDLRGGVVPGNPVGTVGELEALERRGELEVATHIAELDDAERRRRA
ncbi:hypothetical protein F4777DRAFT_560211 [Nemania sp. FL0916]|nr:hypothetical protein F4777DRAFT_560211 [Nemania sp. FL0916]